ncbi:MAG: hypothetical protein U9R60_02895, partial [Bacteroidota bacterium]|nr:hypothetical protein [Bacteroidota bacterium]
MKNKLYTLIILFIFPGISYIYAQHDPDNYREGSNVLSFDGNYRIHPGNVSQTEVFIVKSPLDDNILFSSCNTLTFIPFFVSEGIYITTDGGNSWNGNDTCTGEPIAFHGGDPGIAIDKYGTFIITRLGRPPFFGLYSHYSTDNGQTWSSQQVISTDDLERAALATDLMPSSNYFGRTYAVWVKFAPPFPIMISYTDDGGQNWSLPGQINNPPNRSAGGDICIGPNGEVYVCWAGVTEVSPFKEIYVGFASSTNGGTDWNVNENAFYMNGITGVLPEKGNIRVNGLPGIAVDITGGERHGWIYVITGQKDLLPAGTDPDIILNRSTNGGLSWSDASRVNQDAFDNGKTQYFPTVHIDKFGAVDILYYDDRNTSSDSAGVFLGRSLDGGDHWSEYEISDHNYKPAPIGGLGQGYQGDNIDLISTDTRIWPVWMDNSSGIYQIWTVPIDFTSLDGIPANTTYNFELKQNRPNPFKYHTTIRYRMQDAGCTILKIYDLYGKEVMELLDEIQHPGSYEIEVDLSGEKAGIYYYTLTVNGIT